ncbi:MAG: hypothetical protein KC897_10770 [Candidatus Omnitrophica bacterium]|nr:hypothetical protein [Candidatus Omnitrophota bacterium]MCB9720547.1 hypothetical protein [Candidatus Omnitrophota bacterium]
MDKFWAWWALVFYILPVFISIPLIRRRRRGVNYLLTGVALRYDGAVKSIIGVPYYVGFDLDGIPVSLSLSHPGRRSPAQTSLAVEMDSPFAVEVGIGPGDGPPASGTRWGPQDIDVIRPEFDAEFIVRGPERDPVLRFLTEDLQSLFLKWRRQRVTLSVKNKSLRLTVFELIDEDERLDEFISDARTVIMRASGRG